MTDANLAVEHIARALSIVARRSTVEIWRREPALESPNPSLISQDDVLSIDYLDNPDPMAS